MKKYAVAKGSKGRSALLVSLLSIIAWGGAAYGMSIVSPIENEAFPVDYSITFIAEMSIPDPSTRWNMGDNTPQLIGLSVTHPYSQPGRYKVTAENSEGSATVYVRVIKVDLNIAGVADDAEESVGKILARNNDDDNGNGKPDRNDAPVAGEDDLAKITIKELEPRANATGNVKLSIEGSGSSKVKVWTSNSKTEQVSLPKTIQKGELPKEYWVEGYTASDSQRDVSFLAEYVDDPEIGQPIEDRVKFTIADLLLSETPDDYLPESTVDGGKGNNVKYTGKIKPVGLKGIVYWSMDKVTSLPGHACNSGTDSEIDFKILAEENPNLDVSGYNRNANSNESQTESDIRIDSFDYGGSADLSVKAQIDDGPQVVGVVDGNEDFWAVRMPADYDKDGDKERVGDGLPDSWELLVGYDPNNKDTNGDGILDRDDDTDESTSVAPASHASKGDGLPAFDEYRGFVILEGGSRVHKRLNDAQTVAVAGGKGGPRIKDVFVTERKNAFTLYSGKVHQLGVVWHLVDRQDFQPSFNTINFNGARDQTGIDVIDEKLPRGLLGTARTLRMDGRDVSIDSWQALFYDVDEILCHEFAHKFDLFHVVNHVEKHSSATVALSTDRKRLLIITPATERWMFVRPRQSFLDWILPPLIARLSRLVCRYEPEAVLENGIIDVLNQEPIRRTDVGAGYCMVTFWYSLPANVSVIQNGVRGVWVTRDNVMNYTGLNGGRSVSPRDSTFIEVKSTEAGRYD